MKVISVSALVRRINRKIKHQGEVLRVCPYGSKGFMAVGRYFVSDARTNMLLHADVELEELGREIGALRDTEALPPD